MNLEKHRRMYFTNVFVNSPAQYAYDIQKAEYVTLDWTKTVDADYVIEETWDDGSIHEIFRIHVVALYSSNVQTVTFDTPETTLSDDAVEMVCEFIRNEITNIG